MASILETARAQQLSLRADLIRALLSVWPLLDPTRLDATFPKWALVASEIITKRRATSAALAAQYLQAARFEAGLSGQAVTPPLAPLPAGLLAGQLRITGVVSVKQSMLAGRTVDQAMRAAFVASSGAATRLALDGGRSMIRDSVAADPAVVGYRRVTDGNPCAFCALMASRGAVYKSSGSGPTHTGASSGLTHASKDGIGDAGQAFHDHCGCTLEPVYDRTPLSGREQQWDQMYQDSTAGLRGKAALAAFRKAYSQQ